MNNNWPTWTDDWPFWLAGAIVAYFGLRLLNRALFKDRSRGRRRCPKCWYDMSGSDGLRCPECGYAAKRETRLLRTRRRWRWTLAALGVLVCAALIALSPKVRRDGFASIAPRTVLILLWAIEDSGDVNAELIRRIDEDVDGGVSLDETLWDWQWSLLREQLLDTVETGVTPLVRKMAFVRLKTWDLLRAGDADLVIALLSDPGATINFSALLALRDDRFAAALNTEACVDSLIQMVELHDVSASPLAMERLTRADMHYERIIPLFLAALEPKSGVHWYFRYNACKALSRIGPHDLIDPAAVLPRLSDSEPKVRLAAVEAISSCAAPEYAAPLLCGLLADAEHMVRAGTLAIITTIGPSAVKCAPAVARMLAHDTDENVRSDAAIALWRVHSPPDVAVPALLQALNDPDQGVRLQAVRAIGLFGDAAREAIPILEQLRDAAAPDVQREAEKALRQIRGEA